MGRQTPKTLADSEGEWCLGRKLERETGFEPATSTLARSHSTAELLPLGTGLIITKRAAGKSGRKRLSILWLKHDAPLSSQSLPMVGRRSRRPLVLMEDCSEESSMEHSRSRKSRACSKLPHLSPSAVSD